MKIKASFLVFMLLLSGCGALPRPFQNDNIDNQLLSIQKLDEFILYPPAALSQYYQNIILANANKKLSDIEKISYIATDFKMPNQQKKLKVKAIFLPSQNMKSPSLCGWLLYDHNNKIIKQYRNIIATDIQRVFNFSKVLECFDTTFDGIILDLKQKYEHSMRFSPSIFIQKIDVSHLQSPYLSKALKRLLEKDLADKNAQIQYEDNQRSFTIIGSIKRDIVDRDNEKISLSWKVIDPKGVELAHIQQEHILKNGEFDKNWVQLLPAISQNLAHAIIYTMQQSNH